MTANLPDEAAQTQALLLKIRERQRELDRLTESPASRLRFWRRPRWRFQASLVFLVLAFCARIKIEVQAQSLGLLRVEAPLRARVAQAATIPWRRQTGIGPRGTRCDLWVSGLGLAQIQCGDEVVYRGFGAVGAGGDFHALGEPDPPPIEALEEPPDWFAGEQWERAPLPPDGTANQAAIEATFRGRQSELADCARGAGGTVQLSMSIDVTGKLLSARVEQSSLPPTVERCVIETVQRWRFHRLTGVAPVNAHQRLQL